MPKLSSHWRCCAFGMANKSFNPFSFLFFPPFHIFRVGCLFVPFATRLRALAILPRALYPLCRCAHYPSISSLPQHLAPSHPLALVNLCQTLSPRQRVTLARINSASGARRHIYHCVKERTLLHNATTIWFVLVLSLTSVLSTSNSSLPPTSFLRIFRQPSIN